jgi:hypothetical protein
MLEPSLKLISKIQEKEQEEREDLQDLHLVEALASMRKGYRYIGASRRCIRMPILRHLRKLRPRGIPYPCRGFPGFRPGTGVTNTASTGTRSPQRRLHRHPRTSVNPPLLGNNATHMETMDVAWEAGLDWHGQLCRAQGMHGPGNDMHATWQESPGTRPGASP